MSLERLEGRELLTAVGVPDGLVSWWTADNTAADLKGLNNATLNATYLSNVTYAAGMVGQAFNFDDPHDRAQVADSDSLKFTGSFSIEGWVLARAFNPTLSGMILFRGDDRGGLDPYSLSIEPNGTLRFQVTNASNVSASVSTPIPLAQFLHVAATLDDATGTMKLYLNGTLAAQTVTTIRPFRDLDPTSHPGLGIGNLQNVPYEPFNGLIDELSVYNRALTAGEVQGIYSAGNAGKIKTSTYLSVDFPSVTEGPAGTTTPVTFTIRRVGSVSGQAVVNWKTADGTATAGSDYQAATGQVVFQDGEAQKTVTVNVIGDDVAEPDETFQLELSTTTPAYAVGMGQATIANEDMGVSVGNASVIEGDATNRPLGALVPAIFAGLANPYAMIIGPDGDLYVSDKDGARVLRYDPATGAPLPAPGKTGAEFVSAGSGGLQSARDLAFAPDGSLCVVSEGTDAVLRYDPATGAYLGALVAPGAGGLDAPRGLTFRGGSAYVTSVGGDTAAPGKDSVLRFDAATGAPAGVSGRPGDAVFIASGSGGLDNPSRIVFGPDGRAYVSSTADTTNSATSNSVLRYDGTTGAPAGVSGKAGNAVFVSPGSGGLDGPIAMVFRPDGYLYVTSWRNNSVVRYQAATGAAAGTVIAAGSGGLNTPIDLLFEADGNMLVTSKATNEVLRFGPGSQAAFTVRLSLPSSSPVTVSYATADGTATAGSDYTAVSGTLTFAPGQTLQTILVPCETANDGIAEGTETFSLVLSNAVGATITGGPGVGSIRDYVATKFYVIDDGNVDQTYQYGVAGTPVGNSGLINLTAPRGVASNAAGTTLWVVDASANVYVYDAGGGLVGYWYALGPNPSTSLTQPEGIATNGSDLWVLDNASQKVFKYTGAAALRFGQNGVANSSFSLAKADTNPKGIVTDGSSIWVVDDGPSSDMVFKYSISGKSLGSWTIDPANAHPTGITINPNNPSDVWIVDNGTRKVYQYVAAVGRTSGSQKAAATFALAAGDTNPQDIADPPAGDPIPVGSAASRSMTPAGTVPGRRGLADPSTTLGAVPPMSLSALDQALDGFRSGSSMDPRLDEIVPDVFHARRRRAN
jgi:sugar lactone lactonase YvrE